MKRILCLGIVCLFATLGISNCLVSGTHSDVLRCNDRCGAAYLAAMGGTASSADPLPAALEDSPIGEVLWHYFITGGSDNSPKSIHALADINGDGISDVVVASEDYYIRCLNGATGTMLWQHEIYAGSVYLQNGLDVIPDMNHDDYPDVVVGATGGARLIQCISGRTGEMLWTHDTHEYGDGGWVYQVNGQCDFNNDGVNDILAATGDDGSGTGPQRIYCLNGLTGVSIWERPLGGPGFAVMSIEDCTGDGRADVLAGCSNDAETIGYAKGINGASGAVLWTFTVPGSSVWALQQTDDLNGDGIPDVIIGDFLGSGNIYGLNAATGGQLFHHSIGSIMVLRFARMGDINDDGYSDFIPSHTNAQAMVLDGTTGQPIWTHPVADQCWQVAASTDISGDGIDDVLIGTLYNNNYVYFLNGVSGQALFSTGYGEALDALAAIPDVNGDGSMEMVAGGRNGKVTCFSGGPNASAPPQPTVTANFTADVTEGVAPLLVHFIDTSVAQDTTITSWQWDFNGDGTIESGEQNPSWTYAEEGNYTVSLTVSDGILVDTETKVDFIRVSSAQGALVFGNVSGGLSRIKVEIQNPGSVPVSAVNWSLSLTGGLVLKRAFGGLVDLAANESQVLVASPIIGFGRVSVVVTAEAPDVPVVSTTASAFVLGIFVIIR